MSLASRVDLESNFLKRGIYLITSPSRPIEIGDICKSKGDAIDISPVDILEAFIKPKHRIPIPTFKYPTDIVRGSDTFDYKGILKHITNTNIAIEFFKGLFDRISKGLGLKLAAKYSKEKVQATAYSFTSNTVDSVRPNSLTRSLRDFIPDYDFWKTDEKYYVVTELYNSKEIGIVFLDGSEAELNIVLDAAKIANLEVTHGSTNEGLEVIFYKKDNPIPFGIKLGQLTYDLKEEIIGVSGIEYAEIGHGMIVKSAKRAIPPNKTKAKRRSGKLRVREARIGPPNNFVVRIKRRS